MAYTLVDTVKPVERSSWRDTITLVGPNGGEHRLEFQNNPQAVAALIVQLAKMLAASRPDERSVDK